MQNDIKQRQREREQRKEREIRDVEEIRSDVRSKHEHVKTAYIHK